MDNIDIATRGSHPGKFDDALGDSGTVMVNVDELSRSCGRKCIFR